jgi:hypothetical protein
MKKLLLITLTTFTIVSYASFPVTENTQTAVIETSRRAPLSDNAKILLLSLVFIPAGILGSILLSAGSAFFWRSVLLAISMLSVIYSLYLNFTTDIVFWDWRNYLALIITLPILLITLLAVGFSIG